jgi:hypothetical protein
VIDFELKIILKKVLLAKIENAIDICLNCWEVNSQLVKTCLLFHQLVTIENTQLKEYFAYLFFNCWKYEKLKLKLSNLIFKNK